MRSLPLGIEPTIFQAIHASGDPLGSLLLRVSSGHWQPHIEVRSGRSFEPGNALRRRLHIRLVLLPPHWHTESMTVRELTDSELMDKASRLVRYGAAVFVQTVPEEPHFLLYGPGFKVEITRTDPGADYPGRPV